MCSNISCTSFWTILLIRILLFSYPRAGMGVGFAGYISESVATPPGSDLLPGPIPKNLLPPPVPPSHHSFPSTDQFKRTLFGPLGLGTCHHTSLASFWVVALEWCQEWHSCACTRSWYWPCSQSGLCSNFHNNWFYQQWMLRVRNSSSCPVLSKASDIEGTIIIYTECSPKWER